MANYTTGRKKAKHTPKTLNTEVRDAKALELRLQGLSYPKIGEVMGFSGGTAYVAVARELERRRQTSAENAQQLIAIELDRLDKWLSKLESQIDAGDPKAISTALRIQERRSKLLGLDAPEKKELSGPNGSPIQLNSATDKELLESLIADASGALQKGSK